MISIVVEPWYGFDSQVEIELSVKRASGEAFYDVQMEMTGEASLLPVIGQGTSIQVEITRIAA